MKIADTVAELMRSPIVGIDETATVAQAISLMDDHDIGSMVVTRSHRPAGLFTERDLLRRILVEEHFLDRSVGMVMSSPLVTIASDAIVQDAFDVMADRCIRRLLVEDSDGQIIGIVTERDLLRWVRVVGQM
jgi:CBS domain-containing protein